MTRQRVNPFDQGTAERLLFDRYRKAKRLAEQAEQQAAIFTIEANGHRATAKSYADALRALGHGDKVTPIKALPDFSKGSTS